MEIKTKIIYLIICGYHILPYEIMLTINYKISYFSFKFERKSTLYFGIYQMICSTYVQSIFDREC